MRHLRSLATVLGALSTAAAVLALAPASLAATSSTRLWHPLEISPPKNAGADPIAELNAIACVSARECMAGGRYDTNDDRQLAIVVPEFNGTWARAHVLAMPKNADTQPSGVVAAIACPASRQCVAVGSYDDSSGLEQGFVATQAHGTWQQAQEVSRPADLVANGKSQLSGVACVSVGNCVAVGGYEASAGFAMLAVREAGGHWKRGFGLRNPPSAGAKANPFLFAVSCGAPGHCSAVGSYVDKSDRSQALAVTDTNNRWSQATRITPPRNATTDMSLFGISCVRAGGCTAIGGYEDAKFASHIMAAVQGKHGWLRATEVLLPSGAGSGGLNTISCSAAGSCVAGGAVSVTGGTVPLVATQTSGHWGRAASISLPANTMRTIGRDGVLNGISCLPGNACTVAGWYIDKSDNIQALISTRAAR